VQEVTKVPQKCGEDEIFLRIKNVKKSAKIAIYAARRSIQKDLHSTNNGFSHRLTHLSSRQTGDERE